VVPRAAARRGRARPARGRQARREAALTIHTGRLRLRTLPAAAAARLPADRAGATALLDALLDDEWPQPDLLDLLPSHARRTDADIAFGVWVMVEAATNSVVGDIGFLGPPDEAGEVEIGYSVVPSRRNRGYASEAVAALTRWAFQRRDLRAVVAGTDSDNAASQRVLERAGFERTGADGTEVRWRLERLEGDR
jgi:ribosomal-protein-alanine N-acetyltransferase